MIAAVIVFFLLVVGAGVGAVYPEGRAVVGTLLGLVLSVILLMLLCKGAAKES